MSLITSFVYGGGSAGGGGGGGAAASPLDVMDISDDFVSGTTTTGSVGSLGWTIGGGTHTVLLPEAGHPGIAQKSTGATQNTVSHMAANLTNSGAILPADLFDLTAVVRLNTNDTATDVRFGLADNFSVAPNDGVYIEKLAADTSWFGAANAAATSRTAALAATSTNWVRFRVRRVDASTVGFTVDSGAEATLTTNIPTGRMMVGVHIINSGAAAAKTLDVDFIRIKITGLGR